MYEYAPPPRPPPLLSNQDLVSLIEQGYVSLTLPTRLADLYKTLFSTADDFFLLPSDVKLACFPSDVRNTQQGYYDVPEEKQYLTLRHEANQAQAPQGLDHLLPLVSETWYESAKLLHRVLNDVGAHFGIPSCAWDPITQDCLSLPKSNSTATPSFMRLFKYLPDTGIATPHKDLGLLTLCVGAGQGLQVHGYEDHVSHNKVWKDATEVTVLAGDVLHILSSGRIASGFHRVVGNSNGRKSAIFALRVNPRATIDMSLFGGEGQVACKDFWAGIQKGRLNVNARKELREELRVQS